MIEVWLRKTPVLRMYRNGLGLNLVIGSSTRLRFDLILGWRCGICYSLYLARRQVLYRPLPPQ